MLQKGQRWEHEEVIGEKVYKAYAFVNGGKTPTIVVGFSRNGIPFRVEKNLFDGEIPLETLLKAYNELKAEVLGKYKGSNIPIRTIELFLNRFEKKLPKLQTK